MSKSRSEPATPADEALLQRLAGQAGLLLRNQRLTAELRGRLDDLGVSRRRLLAAGDTPAANWSSDSRLRPRTGSTRSTPGSPRSPPPPTLPAPSGP